MANPLYYRSSNPGLGSVNAKANKLYEWDGTGTMPAELALGKGAMPPAHIEGETTIWSDSFTLGYTSEAAAHPVFFTDGAVGDAKILKMINHVANRVGQPMFVDVAAAKAWASTAGSIYFVEPGAGSGSPSVINLAQGGATQHTLSITNNTNETITRLDIWNLEYHAAGYSIGIGTQVDWLPLEPGQSLEFSGVKSVYGSGGSGAGTTLQVNMGVHFLTGVPTRTGFTTVNGVAGNPNNFPAGGTTNYFNIANAGYLTLANGDALTLTFTN
jgi:hypothetical protein